MLNSKFVFFLITFLSGVAASILVQTCFSVSFVSWFKGLPDILVGAMVGAVVSSIVGFLGAFWTNKGYEKRQNILLEHEKEKYKFEKRMTLKKEVFLEVAEYFSAALRIIIKILDLNYPQKEIEDLLNKHVGSIAKSYLAASEETVKEIINFSADVAQTMASLMRDRMEALDHKKAIEIYESMIETSRNELERISEPLISIKANDKEHIQFLDQQFKHHEKIIQNSSASKAEEEDLLRNLHIQFARKCFSEHGRLLSEMSPMVMAMRLELETDKNHQVFVAALDSNIEKMNIFYESYISNSLYQQD